MFDSKSMTARAGCRTIGLGVALLLSLSALAGCAEIKPYKPFNNREEGSQNGVLTGSKGEFVIFSYRDEPKSE